MRKRVLTQRPGIDPRADQVAARLRALGDPLRLRLLGLLAHGGCPVTALTGALDVGQSLVSFHLGELERAGLVRLERVGRFTYAHLDPDAVRELLGQAGELLGQAGTAAVEADELARRILQAVLPDLHDRFDRLLGAGRVERVAAEEAARLARLDHGMAIAALVAEHATQRLRALGQAERRLPKPVPEVLFVCVHNAARSQMAAALATRRGAGRVHAWSAGSQPAHRVDAGTVAAMAELGVDLAGQVPKPWTIELVRAADVVVTMGCGEDVPQFPGVRYVAWQVPDPAGQPPAQVRRVRDQLAAHVRTLLDGLAPPSPRLQPSPR